MYGKLWALIKNEAEAIRSYHDYLDSDEAKASEAAPAVQIVTQIINDKRDHIEALRVIYDSAQKQQPATKTSESARVALSEYRESTKLIK